MKTQYDIYNDGIGSVEYVEHMGSDITIVNAARVSFGKHKDTIEPEDKKLIKYLIKNRHTSTLEHNQVTFRFKVPLFIRSQHHRHRTWSYNEISRRYTEEDLIFYEPSSFRTQHKTNRQASNTDEINPDVTYLINSSLFLPAAEAMKEFHKNSLQFYETLIEAGVCREQARGVLPQNLYTEYYGSVNLANALKFVTLRYDSHAQWEIQVVAKACLDIMTDLWPETVNAYREINNK
jgi:thymidylate synthase (FAD)